MHGRRLLAKLRIPERYQPGLSAIRTLDDESVRAIRAALEHPLEATTDDRQPAEVPRDPDALAVTALRSVPIKGLDFKRIAEALVGLYGARSTQDDPAEEFADSVCDAMEALQSEEFRLPHVEREQFRQKLITLLGAEIFGIVSKVHDLATEDERRFCSARIMTDLRPVFGATVQDGPRAMVVIHLLKLAYHEGDARHHHFYVALDDKDLQALKKTIERAEAKARTLKAAVKNLRLFGLPKE